MSNNELLDIILDEQNFPCENMSKDERNYYLNILRNCKDICDKCIYHSIDTISSSLQAPILYIIIGVRNTCLWALRTHYCAHFDF